MAQGERQREIKEESKVCGLELPLSEIGTFVGGAGWGGRRCVGGCEFGTCYFCNVKEQLDLEIRGSRRSLELEGYI